VDESLFSARTQNFQSNATLGQKVSKISKKNLSLGIKARALLQ
jgi:hypothetical protein